MIELLNEFPDNVIALSCRGMVTRQDYDDVLVPAIVSALGKHDKLWVYYEAGADFTGIEPTAVWEDFKVGMEHFACWERVALITDIAWMRQTADAFRFFMPAEVRVFSTSEAPEARAWILSS